MAGAAAGASAYQRDVSYLPQPRPPPLLLLLPVPQTSSCAFASAIHNDGAIHNDTGRYLKFVEAEESEDASAAEIAALFSSGGLPRSHLHSAHDLISFLHRCVGPAVVAVALWRR